jgi:hypothetical protein
MSLKTARALVVLACVALACGQARAQDSSARLQEDGPPPPMRYIPEALRAQLSAKQRDLKGRTRLSLELADAQIVLADGHVNADRFEDATRELGIYEALIGDAVAFVHQSGPVDNKRRDQYKRIEMALRAHVPRIETIRRSLPSQNAVYAKATLDYIRGLRTEALNAFYDDTVLREPPRPKREAKPGERAGDALQPSPPKNEKKP